MAFDGVAYKRIWMEKKRAAGLCTKCGRNPPRQGLRQCVACTEYFANRRKYGGGEIEKGLMPFHDIAAKMNISRQRVQAIYDNAMEKVRAECKRRGIDSSMIIGRGFSAISLCEKWADE